MPDDLTVLLMRLTAAEQQAETAELLLDAAYDRVVANPTSQTAEIAYDNLWSGWRSACDDLYAVRMAVLQAGGPGAWVAASAPHPTPADVEIARLQAAYDAALAAESTTYARYMDLPFGTADEAAEVEWLAARTRSEVLHEDLLAAIDARRDGISLHSVIMAQVSTNVNTNLEATR